MASESTSTAAVPRAERIAALLSAMTLGEKIGQMCQCNVGEDGPQETLIDALRAGRIGSVINVVDVDAVNELQRVAVEESRLGVPLLVGRDVIHGFETVMPIPLGLAATWHPEIIEEGARVSAQEAAAAGINWTFAPMIDVTRDPRWGRVAESPGEDAFLATKVAAAMVRGFQGTDLSATDSIAACAKHLAGYGASESGRDYAATSIPENELRNVHLPAFEAAVKAGVASMMAAFNDLNGVPASGNEFLLRQVLRDEWGFQGLVVSDWYSVQQLAVHGFTADDKESVIAALRAGVDMEMASTTYAEHLESLVDRGSVDVGLIDAAVSNILALKFDLGLFERPYTEPVASSGGASAAALATAHRSAVEATVLLKNAAQTLPLETARLRSLALIGPLADAPYEQLGTWVFDGDPRRSITNVEGIRRAVGDAIEVRHAPAMESSRSRSQAGFADAVAAAESADAVIVFLGEESILSGEAHSRADIGLPGVQEDLVRALRETGKPLIAVILAGRPLTIAPIVEHVDAILYAWHPGTMGGAAIADLLFGNEVPSAKLPITFPRMVGQVPIYYNQKNTGRPPTPDTVVMIDDIPIGAPQASLGNTSFHLDAGHEPLFEFGFGLSYTDFAYSETRVSRPTIKLGESLTVSAKLTNVGAVAATEVVQLYVRDLVGSVTRPVRELKGFQRVRLEPGETGAVSFELHTDDLAFYGRDNRLAAEPGDFHVWVGGSSRAEGRVEFRLVDG